MASRDRMTAILPCTCVSTTLVNGLTVPWQRSKNSQYQKMFQLGWTFVQSGQTPQITLALKTAT